MSGPEHGEGDPYCQISPLRSRVQTSQMGRERDRLAQLKIVYFKLRSFQDAMKGPTEQSRSVGLYAQPVEQQGRGVAVRQHAEFLLFGANIVAQIEIDVTFELIHFVPECREFFLQGDACIARQL